MIRWHFTFDKAQYLRLLSIFIKSYLKTTVRGKRSILRHMQKIDFDFYKFVDLCFKSLTGHFVPLQIAFDVVLLFLTEGVKILFRFTYAVMKHHKHFIKTCHTPEELIAKLKSEARLCTDP
jgi:hypothetical protein